MGLATFIGSSSSLGLTGDFDLRLQENTQPEAGFIDPHGLPEVLVAEGLRSSSFQLKDNLLGAQDLSLSEIMESVDPVLNRELEKPDSPYRLQLVEQTIYQGVFHKTYQLRLGDLDVYGAFLKVHESDQLGIQMVRAKWPLLSDWPTNPTPLLNEAWDRFQARTGFREIRSMRPVIVLIEGKPVTCWEVITGSPGWGQESILVHGTLGDRIYGEVTRFDMTSVYDKNPKEGALIKVPLEDLKSTNFLDSTLFTVWGAKEGGSPEEQTRASIPDQEFAYDPNHDPEKSAFDQVQTYYYATRSLKWLHQNFGPDPGPVLKSISIFVGGTINGRNDNAVYLPAPEGPAVVIARNDRFDSLARDRDVVTHELAHHIIFRGIKSSQGESGMLHEGTADYLTYVQSNDPYLAESIVPGAPYLRTALLSPNLRFDVLSPKAGNHIKGQYWSALLWRLGERVGHQRVLQWVRSMILYGGPRAGIKDALLGMVRGDRDLVVESQRQESPGAASALRSEDCAILEEAVGLGFAGYLGDFDGEPCNLDLPQLAQKSLARASKINQGPKSSTQKAGGCGVIALQKDVSQNTNFWAYLSYLVAMGIPLLVYGTHLKKRSSSWISINYLR